MPRVLAMLIVLVFAPRASHAAFDEVRIAVEGGAATLAQTTGRSWGGGGALSLELSIIERLALRVHLDASWLGFRDATDPPRALSQGAALIYAIDTGRVIPFVGAGLGIVDINAETQPTSKPMRILTLEAGFDAAIGDEGAFFWGGTVRYYPIFETDLLSNPAYTTISAHLGVRFEL